MTVRRVQVYAVPLLAKANRSLLLARVRTPPDARVRVRVGGIGQFVLAALVASVIHPAGFRPGPAAWGWFAAPVVVTMGSLLVGTSRRT